MATNRLLLNPSKTKAIWLGGCKQLAKIDILRLSFLFPRITFSTCARDFGVMLDPELTFSHHINLVARKCYYQLRQLRVVSRSLTHQSTLSLVHAFVTSRIDCCSSLLVELPSVGASSAFSCPSCWRTAQVFFYHCLHARCATLAAYL